ncbi:MAG TPA: endonuclease III [Salinivirgaceae bacterium]|nr:endonuclease III [Salinivirgaceae bacterium]
MKKQEKINAIVEYFQKNNPNPTTELKYQTPFQLLVSVVLSAQCTDKRVNAITPELFRCFPDPYSMSKGSADEIFNLIKSCSYPNSKSRYLHAIAQKLVNDFDGNVPSTIDELQSLPGVGRKTANVVLSVLFNEPTMPVDTHVFRVASRLGLTTHAKNPLQAEKQLLDFFDKSLLHNVHHWLILHGRYVCRARKPQCHECGLSFVCSYYEQKYHPKNTLNKKKANH